MAAASCDDSANLEASGEMATGVLSGSRHRMPTSLAGTYLFVGLRKQALRSPSTASATSSASGGRLRCRAGSPLMLGSHIDTVIDAGIYDGCYGVLAGLEVIETLREPQASAPKRPIAVAAFTNEEGVRFAPDMMGSLVHAGGPGRGNGARRPSALTGQLLGEELARIGYAGDVNPRFPQTLMPMWSCISSRGRCWSARACHWRGRKPARHLLAAHHHRRHRQPCRHDADVDASDAGYAAARVIAFLQERARLQTPRWSRPSARCASSRTPSTSFHRVRLYRRPARSRRAAPCEAGGGSRAVPGELWPEEHLRSRSTAWRGSSPVHSTSDRRRRSRTSAMKRGLHRQAHDIGRRA